MIKLQCLPSDKVTWMYVASTSLMVEAHWLFVHVAVVYTLCCPLLYTIFTPWTIPSTQKMTYLYSLSIAIACIKLRPYFLPLLFSYAECVRCPWHFRGCTPGAHSVGSWKPLSLLHCAISILLYKACKAVMYSPLGTQGVVMLYRIRSVQTDVRSIGQDH